VSPPGIETFADRDQRSDSRSVNALQRESVVSEFLASRQDDTGRCVGAAKG